MSTQTFPISQAINLVARVGYGSMHVTAVEGLDTATVTMTPRGAATDILNRTTAELRGSTLTIQSPRQGGIFDVFGSGPHEAVDIAVRIPGGTPVKISCVSADVIIDGRCGRADLASGASDVSAEHIDGDLRLRTGDGNAHIERVSGGVNVRAGTGFVRFGEVSGAIVTACGSGRLEVDVAGGSVRFRAGSGGVTLGCINGDVDLASSSGEFRIGLPEGISAQLDLTTGSGRVDSQLPIVASAGTGRPITVRARTGRGDVHLFRAA